MKCEIRRLKTAVLHKQQGEEAYETFVCGG